MNVHRTKLKIVINPVLRVLQCWTNRPVVIASVINNDMFVKYTLVRVKYTRVRLIAIIMLLCIKGKIL